ncbi:MAG: hypothetical protein GY906_12170 [bacterium]|nr:hypothetical protein [bacterium]
MLEQGPMEQRIIKQCLRSRKPFPEKIANAPALALGLDLYWDAFQDLNTCRTSGFGAGPIPWSVILDYSRKYEFDEEQEEDLFYFIRVMDNEFLEHHSKKEK